MRVTVRLFAILRDRAGGAAALTIQLPDNATVGRAAEEIAKRLPAISGSLPRIAFAINCEYVRLDAVLRDGDELALIPPVSGG